MKDIKYTNYQLNYEPATVNKRIYYLKLCEL
jgi:hypothetical protein